MLISLNGIQPINFGIISYLLIFFMASPERIELSTFGSVDQRSIQLSYGDIKSGENTPCEKMKNYRTGPWAACSRIQHIGLCLCLSITANIGSGLSYLPRLPNILFYYCSQLFLHYKKNGRGCRS